LLSYFDKSANAFIEPKKDCYLNCNSILRQFDRLFKLVKFKKSFANYSIETIVDNARTHTAVDYDVNLLSKSPNTNCPYDKIEWIEGDLIKSVNCFDSSGTSKGLLQIAKEMNIIDLKTQSRQIKLDELREKISLHPAFSSVTKLEKLAKQFCVKIIWCPKYHCELNPIEGLWCYSKRFVRENNEQNFNKLFDLIQESFFKYKASNLNIKLWHRFWTCVHMYNEGDSYKDVLTKLFSHKKSDKPLTHTRITNTNIED